MKKVDDETRLDADDFAKRFAEVKMVTPWAVGMRNTGRSTSFKAMSRGSGLIQEGRVLTEGDLSACEARLSETGLERFVEQRSEVHKEFIRQAEITKRWGMATACLCVVASAAVLVFAPEGREITSYVVGAALVVLAAGAFGFTKASASNGKNKVKVSRG